MKKINVSKFTEVEIANLLLPHGSGFNADWETSIEDETFVGKMVYDHMSEEGFYDFVVPFVLKVPLCDAMGFSVELVGSEEQNRLSEEDDLVSYFEDTIAYAIEDGFEKNIVPILLRELNEDFDTSQEGSTITYAITRDGEPWGTIMVSGGEVTFVHGRIEPKLKVDDPHLPEWVEAYSKGFDCMEDLL